MHRIWNLPTPLEKTQLTKRLDFALLSAWVILSLVLGIIAFLWFGMDFRVYYAAARVLVAGENLYDYQLISQALLEFTGEIGNNSYYYPPWFAWIFTPLILIPFQAARAVWLVLNVLMWNMGLWQLGKFINWPTIGWRRYALFALATLSFAWITWRYEQAGILVFIILIALISSISNERWNWSGLWLALLLSKPNVTLIIVAGISLWLLRQRRSRTVLIAVLTVMGLLSVSTLITPDWFQPFLKDDFGTGLTMALDGPNRVVAQRINTTFLDWLRTFGIDAQFRTFLYGIVIILGMLIFFWAVYHSRSILQLTSILLLVSYAITPYALQYDYPPLIIVLYWSLSSCASSPKAWRVGMALASFVFSVIFWQQNISWAYWMVIGLIALSVWGQYQELRSAAVGEASFTAR